MKEYYLFKIIDTYSPTKKDGEIKDDSNIGGIKNSYNIYLIKYVELFNKEFIFKRTFLGTSVFLLPLKTTWNKYIDRLPKIYWGKLKSPFINKWLVLTKDYNTLRDIRVLTYTSSTQSSIVKVFNISFESKLIKKALKRNQSFKINQKF